MKLKELREWFNENDDTDASVIINSCSYVTDEDDSDLDAFALTISDDKLKTTGFSCRPNENDEDECARACEWDFLEDFTIKLSKILEHFKDKPDDFEITVNGDNVELMDTDCNNNSGSEWMILNFVN